MKRDFYPIKTISCCFIAVCSILCLYSSMRIGGNNSTIKLSDIINEVANNNEFSFNINRIFNNEQKTFSIGSMVHGNSTTGDPHNYKYYCKDFKKAGLSVVRIEPCDEMYYFQKEGIDILAYMRYPDKETIQKYNGETIISLDGEPVKINVKFWEFGNELDILYWRNEMTIEEIFNRLKNAYLLAKSIRSDIKVVLGAPANITSGDYFEKLCYYTDSNNKHIWDYCDVFNIHCYPNGPSGINLYLEKLESMMGVVYQKQFSDFSEKEIWITECGYDTFRYTEEFQARSLAPMFLSAFSKGISKVINYCYLYSEGYSFNTESELFYGIVHEGIGNSYISFLRNDGEYKTSLSNGEALLYKPIYTNEKFKQLSLTQYDGGCLERILESGLAVSGEGFTINAITICNNKENVIWTGEHVVDSCNVLSLDKELFAGLEKGSIIKVYISNVENTQRLYVSNKPKPAYYAISKLCDIIGENISVRSGSDYSIAVIQNHDRCNYVIWSNHELFVDTDIINSNVYTVYNYLGEPLSSPEMSCGPYYVEPKINN